ncbi:MAG TPA: hypothetical protein VJZ00_07515, partial [Thermoanaerobaculia bacterium]|nr:hypothetical protein [Thermoanaerobaculia bacterium]
MNRWTAVAALALVAVAALHVASIPRTIWEYDESFFSMAVERYQPLVHHPPPPGYPLYIGFAKLIPTDPFHALLFTSVLATLAGLVIFTFAFRDLTGSAVVGLVGAVVLYASPAVLISGTLPQSDAGALALLGLAIWACGRGNPFAMGVACAAAIGWRLQFSIVVVPMFVVAMFQLRVWRERIIALATFGVACLAWFVPLVMAAGGPESWWHWLSGQAAYYAEHDSHLSRSGVSKGLIALRFLAHPWGPKWLALPLLVLAIVGLAERRRPRRLMRQRLAAARRRDAAASAAGDGGVPMLI